MLHLYHATSKENADLIEQQGRIKPGIDGVVYLTNSEENALKFMIFKTEIPIVVVLKIELTKLDGALLEESHDYPEEFFKCKTWAYKGEITLDKLSSVIEYAKKQPNVGAKL